VQRVIPSVHGFGVGDHVDRIEDVPKSQRLLRDVRVTPDVPGPEGVRPAIHLDIRAPPLVLDDDDPVRNRLTQKSVGGRLLLERQVRDDAEQ